VYRPPSWIFTLGHCRWESSLLISISEYSVWIYTASNRKWSTIELHRQLDLSKSQLYQISLCFMYTSKYTLGPGQRSWTEISGGNDGKDFLASIVKDLVLISYTWRFFSCLYEVYTLVPTHRLVLCWQLTCTAWMFCHALWHFGPLCVYLLMLAFWCGCSI